jgi:hypothetical protein
MYSSIINYSCKELLSIFHRCGGEINCSVVEKKCYFNQMTCDFSDPKTIMMIYNTLKEYNDNHPNGISIKYNVTFDKNIINYDKITNFCKIDSFTIYWKPSLHDKLSSLYY